jgi:hypothetical protein
MIIHKIAARKVKTIHSVICDLCRQVLAPGIDKICEWIVHSLRDYDSHSKK